MKNNEAIVIHLPGEKRLKAKRLSEFYGFASMSEYGRSLIEKDLEANQAKFEHMKTIFEPD